MLRRVVDDEPDLGRIPEALLPVVSRALSKNPAERPTAEELLLFLHHLHGADGAISPALTRPPDPRGAATPTTTGDTAPWTGAAPGSYPPAPTDPAGVPLVDPTGAPSGAR
ncbi:MULTISPECIES: hypothetical protein [Pseudofrankia]|uniref:hypothetical protein n=1 Tax=Pseudofrankia TaxID=2994363 RepID=UPI000234BD58|nr:MULTISPECIES: hypothetical protein [Pseudofrankia]OHV37022.1 hypothetical protein BCD49_17445 [Pseudofrankia sp. EUN1h]